MCRGSRSEEGGTPFPPESSCNIEISLSHHFVRKKNPEKRPKIAKKKNTTGVWDMPAPALHRFHARKKTRRVFGTCLLQPCTDSTPSSLPNTNYPPPPTPRVSFLFFVSLSVFESDLTPQDLFGHAGTAGSLYPTLIADV